MIKRQRFTVHTPLSSTIDIVDKMVRRAQRLIKVRGISKSERRNLVTKLDIPTLEANIAAWLQAHNITNRLEDDTASGSAAAMASAWRVANSPSES